MTDVAGARLSPAVARGPARRPRTPPTTVVALVCVALVGTAEPVVQSLNVGTLAAIALVPLWWGATRAFHDLRGLLWLALGCALVGAWLTELASVDHDTSGGMLVNAVFVLLNAVLGAVVVAWGRTRASDPAVAVAFGIGMVLGINTGGRFAENPWRFGFSVPLIVLLLGLAWMAGRGLLQVVLTLALAGVSAASGGRSTSAMLVLAAVVTVQQLVGRDRTGAVSRFRAVVLVGGLVVALYYLGQAAILDGYLGKDAQERTQEQIALSGSLIAGARPEIGATTALVEHRPYGFGAGTFPNTSDLLAAKAGMAELRYDPDNGYVERYMFGSGIELHSTAADLWAAYGVLGAALAVAVLWVVLRGYTEAFSTHAASALLTYLAIRTVWNLLFSPLTSSVTLLALAVGLLLVRRAPRPGEDPPVAAALPGTAQPRLAG